MSGDNSRGDMSDTIGGGGAMGDMSGNTPLSGGTPAEVNSGGADDAPPETGSLIDLAQMGPAGFAQGMPAGGLESPPESEEADMPDKTADSAAGTGLSS